jgi:hypothetical protein
VVGFFSSRRSRDIIAVMRSDEDENRLLSQGNPGISGPATFALLAALLVGIHRASLRRSRPTGCSVSCVGWMVTPTTAVGFAASPAVTTPAASVARFSVWPLPMVAGVVDARRLREVTVARIGGLYGP